MQKFDAFTGNLAVATAMKQVNPDVCAAYPITPSTDIMMIFSDFVANGEVNTELVTVESEHSAMSACIGAALAGGRVMTATSSAGLAYMWELLGVASGLRCSMIMTCVNRALSAPLNIHCDHSDAMGARDTGWIQIFSENAQEAYDNIIQAVRITEHRDVRLPVMVCLDGFIISHSYEKMQYMEDKDVKDFIGEFKPYRSLLNVDKPETFGAMVLPNYYMEFKRQVREGMENARQVILEIGKEFGDKFGRYYSYFEEYMLEDAEVVFVVMSSAAGTVKHVVNNLRKRGVKAGVLKPRVFRPFPHVEASRVLRNAKFICVLDRAETFGGEGGPLYLEIKSALQTDKNNVPVVSRIFGLGQRDFLPIHVENLYEEIEAFFKTGKIKMFDYVNVRE
ncbi:MAG: pyruvate ferredoxin oxidoreductase [Proteobacteria bacterium]|nr:pyruvate ferredoxin oxidoreductase [Pseudomonadota bacterium]